MSPSYPVNDFNRGQQLLLQLGSFWVNVFADEAILREHLHSVGQARGQTYLNFLEAVACVSRLTVPLFHTENWQLLTIKQTEVLGLPSTYRSDDLVYGEQTGEVNDRPAGFVQTYNGTDFPGRVQVELPGNLKDVPFTLQNLMLSPSRVLVKGLNFDIDTDRNVLRFRTDPFADTLIPKREIFDDNGVQIDQEIALWIFRGQLDRKYLQDHFGYALGLTLSSTQGQKDILNALWDMYVQGPADSSVRLFLAAVAGAPTVIDPEEVVEVIRTESTQQLVITGTRVYTLPLDANVVVSVGQTLHAGDPVSDAIRVAELSCANPDYSLLPALSLSSSFLSGGYVSELVVHNRRVNLDYKGVDNGGKAIVEFEVTGFPGDVEKFWNEVHTNGVAAGKTLANLLDLRANPTTEPVPINLPAQVNPMEFILANLLRNNLFVIRVRQASFPVNASGLSFFKLLRNVIPPHTTYVVFVELTLEDSIDLSVAGGEDEPGVEETVSKFKGAGPISEVLYEVNSSPIGDVATYGDAHVSARLVSLTCQ